MMKNILLALFISLIGMNLNAQKVKPKAVKKTMEKVADWQIEHFRDTFRVKHKKPHHIADWTNGALYVGMVKWAEIAKSEKYYEWLKSVAEEQKWKLHRRRYHADDHAIGQMYIELFRHYGDSSMIQATVAGMDYIIENKSSEPITLDKYKHLERWTWCDALFMAPPVLAKLANIKGDEKYTRFMMEEYKATTDHLFDNEEYLYYRDNSYIGKLDNGNKIFWSRGNGWVFGGLTLIMEEYPKNSKEYAYFLDIYKKMAEKLISIQTEEGHWAMSLLGAKDYPTPETSGTSFFTFGLAWGINNGILDKSIYEPAVKKAWNCLTSHVTKDGMLGYVQPIGAAPGSAWPDKTEVYGTGAFLAAGSEVYKLYGGK